MKNLKKGSAVATYPVIIFVSSICLIAIGIFLINSIFPFIWYQKLNSTAQKYMFVIEKFGYLTDTEKQNLLNELSTQGFNVNNIRITAPQTRKLYGELIELKIEYDYEHKNIIFANNRFNTLNNKINMVVSKNSYSKI